MNGCIDDVVGERGGELQHARVVFSTAPSIPQCLQPHLLSYFNFYIQQQKFSKMASKTVKLSEADARPEHLMALYQQMDALWTRYLTLLDEYVLAQATIKKQMASGFLSLAQANFKSPTRRYGQDYYDDRAMASARVRITETEHGTQMAIVRHTFGNVVDEKSIAISSIDTRSEDSDGDKGGPKSESTQLPSPSPTPEPQRPESSDEKHDDGASDVSNINTGSTAHPVSFGPSPHDPIRWFGILVPPPLRAAQKSFSASVQDGGGVVQAANAARELRDTEAQLRKLRKLIKKAERGVLSDQHVQD